MRHVALCWAVAVSWAAAGDLELIESGSDLAAARLSLSQERQLLQWAVEDNRRTIEAIETLDRLRQEQTQVEQALIAAEKRGDETKLDELIERLDELELDLEQAELTAELLNEQRKLNRFLGELIGDRLTDDVNEGFSLRELQKRRLDGVAKLFEAYRNDDESIIDRRERAYEALEQDWSRGLQRLELKVELYWARAEGEEEFADELARELDALSLANKRRKHWFQGRNSERIQSITLTPADLDAAAKLDFYEAIRPLLKTYCFDCHNTASADGDFDLEQIASVRPLVINRQHWLNAVQQIKLRSMPPADVESPTDEERIRLAAWLTQAIEQFDYTTVASPGYEPARRLTHEEYNNTIRDLFGVDLRPADRFPADFTATSGFDNSANSLFLQPILMERYFAATEAMVDELLPLDQTTPRNRTMWNRVLRQYEPRDALPTFLRRVYRRPLAESEIALWQARFDERGTSAKTPRETLRELISVALISPKFLLRSESPVSRPSLHVNDHDLANRLSYFLWASMPDDALFAIADQQQMKDVNVLQAQVDRMLDDPKSDSLGRLFVGQWLGFSKLDRVRPDRIDNPWATDTLINAMKAESAEFFNSLVRENAPIERLVDADYSFVNEELARHYGLRGVRGDQLRRINVSRQNRGGILGQASILAVTSFPGRTSPVLRGNWILSELLGTPPPPPPPNVSQFDEELEALDDLSPRERLEAHRDNPNCYVCHSEIDPLGFALDEFDWFGRDRSRRDGRRVDARGQLPDGTIVEGLAGLKKAIVNSRRDDLVEQLTRKMLSYALGRQLDYYDEATVQKIIAEVEADGRRIRSLIHAVIRSDAFQKKQVPPMETADVW